MIEVRYEFACRIVPDLRSRGHLDDEIRGRPSVTVAASTVAAVFRAIELLILAIQKSVQGGIRLNNYRSAGAAVTPIGSSFGDVRLPTEAEASRASVAGNHSYADLIYEFQGSATKSAGGKTKTAG